MNTPHKAFRKMDLICILSVILLAVFFLLSANIFLGDSDELLLKLDVNGKTEYLSLNSDKRLEINSNGITLNIVIENGAAWVETASCPDGICKTMGKLYKNGQMVVCAPASVALTVQTNNDAKENADAITR